MNWFERKIVLNYLYSINRTGGLFVIIDAIKAKIKGQAQYDMMSFNEKHSILKKIVVDYLTKRASESLFGYSTHGTPDKRIARIRESMCYKFDNLSLKESQIIYQKILDN